MEILSGDERPFQRVAARFVPNPQLDPGIRIRLEDRQAGSHLARFLHVQGEPVTQLDRRHAHLHPAFRVPVGQQSAHGGWVGPDLDPSPPHGSRSGTAQDAAAQGWNLECGLGTEQFGDRLAVLAIGGDDDGRTGPAGQVAERHLHRPAAPIHVIREVQDRLPLRILRLELDGVAG